MKNSIENLVAQTDIEKDTYRGLSAIKKYLLPKYFYDDRGSKIFQDIMNMPEYYLTRCELEILKTHKKKLINAMMGEADTFDLIELGSGDGLKTKILLSTLVHQKVSFNYMPIDISEKANLELKEMLRKEIPELQIETQTGDYFHIMRRLNNERGMMKVFLFLGSNIGNFAVEELNRFLLQLAEYTHPGDKALIGFDLKKDPNIIKKAYDDPHGYTRDFNLNLLLRLNRELGANFNVNNFEHQMDYNPETGAAKSFLISKTEHEVYIEALEKRFQFGKYEAIFMELSRKFDLETINNLAECSGFEVIDNLTDSHEYFADSLWKRI